MSVPPARETETGVVGLTEGMSPIAAGEVASGAAAVSDAMAEVAMSTTGAVLDSGRIMVMIVVRVPAELTAGAGTSAGELAAGGAASGVEAGMATIVEETSAGLAETAPSCAPPDTPPNVKD